MNKYTTLLLLRASAVLALRRLFDCLYVGEVLPSAGGAFCCQQVFTGNEVCPQIGFLVENVFNPARPCGVKLDAGIAVRMSTPTGSRPMRKNGPGSAKSAGVRPCSGAPNSAKAAKTALCVSGIGLHQNVEVFGRAGLRMNRYGVSANDKVLNAVRVQNGQEFCVV
jgi:hypothetical protein